MVVHETGSHPVRDTLVAALTVRYDQLLELFGRLPSQSEWSVLGKVLAARAANFALAESELEAARRVLLWTRMLEPLLHEISELESWSHPPLSHAERNSQADQFAKLLLSNGMEFHDLEKSAARARKRGSGAPAKRRSIAAGALELKKLNPTKSWMQITIQCCNCGRSKHTAGCMQVVRQEVMALEKVLRKYGIHPWEQPQVRPA